MAKPGLMIALGLHSKPKPESAPPRYAGSPSASPGPGDPDAANEPAESGSITPEEVDYSENDTCSTCSSNDSGNCAKYHFPVSETGHCEAGYSPKDGGDGGSASPLSAAPPAGGSPGGDYGGAS